MLQKHTVYPIGRTKGVTSPDQTHKKPIKPKDLSVCECQDRDRGEGGGVLSCHVRSDVSLTSTDVRPQVT